MNCAACGTANLTGGVRCAYCGEHLPVAIEFDIDGAGSHAPDTAAPVEPGASKTAASGRAGLLGLVAILALKAKSLLFLLKFGKIATTLVTMMAFIAADGAIFGWRLGVAIGVSILIHELGHVYVNWRKGLEQSAPMFIPFLGAVIFVKRFPDDPTVQSECGAGGPCAGGLAAVACVCLGLATGNPFWYSVAYLGFKINLFNLLPFAPLDGASMATVFSPRIWSGVLVCLLLWALKVNAPILWPILIVGFIARLGMADSGRHMLAMPSARMRMAVLYIVLSVGMSYGAERAAELRRSGEPVHAAASQLTTQTARTARGTSHHVAGDSDLDMPAFEAVIVLLVRATVLGFVVLGWLCVTALLCRAAGARLQLRAFSLAAAMIGLGAALVATNGTMGHGVAILGGYLAATATALVYAIYVAAHNWHATSHPPYAGLFARTMAWTAAGGAIVVYAAEDRVACVVLAVVIAAFYFRFRWMPLALVAGAREQLGDIGGSIQGRERALALGPDADSAASLLTAIARTSLLLERGEVALSALDHRAALLSQSASAEGSVLQMRAYALALVGRYDDALAHCELILHKPARPGAQAAKLFAVHSLLARIARFRGWPDEAQAQADWCLRAAPITARALLADLRVMRAWTAADTGDADTAQADCVLLHKLSREPRHEAAASTVLAQVSLLSGDNERALGLSERAMHIMPGHLGVRFWRARVLIASGQCEDGQTILRELVSEYGTDYWGRRSAEQPV